MEITEPVKSVAQSYNSHQASFAGEHYLHPNISSMLVQIFRKILIWDENCKKSKPQMWLCCPYVGMSISLCNEYSKSVQREECGLKKGQLSGITVLPSIDGGTIFKGGGRRILEVKKCGIAQTLRGVLGLFVNVVLNEAICSHHVKHLDHAYWISFT